MRAAVYNPYWDSWGGGERYSAFLAQALLRQGWQVDIWWDKDISEAVKARFGLDINGINCVNSRSSLGYDLLFWVSDGSLPISFAGKTLIHFQFPFQQVGGMFFKNRIKSRFYKFVVNSSFTKRFIDKEFAVNSVVLYPPVPVEQIRSGKKENIILYVGRFSQLTQAKNQHLLIDVFKKVTGKLPGWKLVLAGGTHVGTDEKYMRRLVSSSGRHPIDIIKNPDWKQLKNLYAKSWIFFSASGFGADENTQPLKVEHFGMSLVEAMAAGCVPVVVNLGGHKEIVTNGENGYLWDSLDQAGQQLIDLAENPKLMAEMSDRITLDSGRFSGEEFINHLNKLIA